MPLNMPGYWPFGHLVMLPDLSVTNMDICIISYPLFADVDTWIHPHVASQYHAWPKASRGIAILNVDSPRIRGSKQRVKNLSHQSGRSPKVVALFSATNFSSYIIKLLQLHDTIQIKWNYAWIHYNIAIRNHLMIEKDV